jgi:hypothetical protein
MDEELFAKNASPHVSPMSQAILPSMSAQVTNIATRLKLIEDRYSNLAKRNQLTEGSLLAFEKDIKSELRALTRQTVELRKHVSEINSKVDMMVGELGNVVKKHEFAVVERYLDLWQPMNFVTREQAKRIIEDMKSEGDARK